MGYWIFTKEYKQKVEKILLSNYIQSARKGETWQVAGSADSLIIEVMILSSGFGLQWAITFLHKRIYTWLYEQKIFSRTTMLLVMIF